MSKAPAVDYALKIIEFLAGSNGEAGISDICNGLNINKNATSRVLDALMEQKWIYLSNEGQKKYRLTMKPFSLTSKSVEGNNVVKISKPYLSDIHNILGDSVYLGIRNGDNVLYQLHFDSVKEVRINGCVGGEYPLHCSAPGKVLLSYGDRSDIEEYFKNPITKRTDKTIVSSETFFAEADNIRKNGYAVDDEEFAKGIVCIACPVFDCYGNAVAAIGISSLTLYDNIDSLINEKYLLIKDAALNISLSLGYRKED